MISLIITLIAIVAIVYLFLKWVSSNHDVFEKQGLKYIKPLPLLGNCQYIFRGRGLMDQVVNTYNAFPNENVVGIFEFTTPTYFIRNPEIVKQLTVKDFPHFQDHRLIVDTSTDEFFGSMLFSMKGSQWRDMRSSLSPMFTGSKMRTMLQLIIKCTKQFVEYIHEDHEKNGLHPYRVKNVFSRYTNDVIATCAFGVECDSLKHPNNQIYMFSQEMLKVQRQSIKLLLMRYIPRVTNMLGITVLEAKTKKMFDDLILNTMDVRKKEGIVRPDMLQLLMKLRDGQQLSTQQDSERAELDAENELVGGNVKRSWTDNELVAQCFLFFVAGFDTTSTVMQFLAYELAQNQDVQSKLIESIDETYESLGGGELNYETLLKMKYLDMVICESLRKWPPAVATDRQCVKSYTYEGDNGLMFTVNEGDLLWVPIYAFHMDPQYFPDPEKFDPERFSDDNKAKINMDAYLPFGVGPRNCIGMRFALMEVKALVFYLFLNFRVNVCKETQIPLKFKRNIFGMLPEKEIQLLIEPRKDRKNF